MFNGREEGGAGAAELALIVAAIAAGSGIVQGVVQGILSTRGAKVAASQQAIKAQVDLLAEVRDRLAVAARSVNQCMPELVFDPTFLDRDGWDKRGPMLDRLLTAHGQALDAAQGLPADSPARQVVLDSLDLVIAMGAHKDPQLLNGKWKAENRILRDAFDKLGTETQRRYAELETSARGPRAVERARRRIGGAVHRPGTRRLDVAPGCQAG
jgi:Flp pilus assembly pilin Flp